MSQHQFDSLGGEDIKELTAIWQSVPDGGVDAMKDRNERPCMMFAFFAIRSFWMLGCSGVLKKTATRIIHYFKVTHNCFLFTMYMQWCRCHERLEQAT
jgi:hypothetical protein